MRLAMTRARYLVAVAVAGPLLLAACNGQEGSAETEASPQVPDVATPVTAITADPGLARRELGFAGNDGNGDGRVTPSEYAAGSQRFFAAVDTGDDGTLDLEELESARSAIGVADATSSLKTIAAADNDGDGKLTLAEFIALVNQRFTRSDSDGDRLLTPAEFARGFSEVPGAAMTAPAAAETAAASGK